MSTLKIDEVFELPPPKLVQHAVMEAIEQAMWSEKVKLGSHLVETDLAGMLGVSRGSVREALRQLELRGLVRYEPHRGFFVMKWGPRELEEVCSLRAHLEGFAARLAAERIDDTGLDRLEDIIEQMHKAARADDFVRFVQADADFHAAVARSSEHRLLVQQIELFSPHLRMFIALSKTYRVVYPDLGAIADTHLPLVEALRSRDPFEAERVMTKHIRDVGEAFARALK